MKIIEFFTDFLPESSFSHLMKTEVGSFNNLPRTHVGVQWQSPGLWPKNHDLLTSGNTSCLPVYFARSAPTQDPFSGDSFQTLLENNLTHSGCSSLLLNYYRCLNWTHDLTWWLIQSFIRPSSSPISSRMFPQAKQKCLSSLQ